MPNCHHCKKYQWNADRKGACGTCQSANVNYCAVCGWWELGPPDNLTLETLQGVRSKLTRRWNPVVDCSQGVPKNDDAARITAACSLMTYQLDRSGTFTATGYNVVFWRAPVKKWEEAVSRAVHWLSGFADPRSEENNNYGPRMTAMLVTLLSAYQQCIESQLARMAGGDVFSFLNLHDVSTIAAKHYELHRGFGASEKFLDLDTLTLTQVDTVEQVVKQKMTPQMGGWNLTWRGSAEECCEIVENAALLLAAFLVVVQPYDRGQTIPFSTKTFVPDNLPSGIYMHDGISGCFDDYQYDGGDPALVSTSYMARIKELKDAVLAMPNRDTLRTRWESTKGAQEIFTNTRLSNKQKYYLLTLQDLDDPKWPSGCRAIVYALLQKRLFRFLKAIAASDDVTNLLATVDGNFSRLLKVTKESEVGLLIDELVDRGRRGYLPLQTSATNIGFILGKPYRSLFAVYQHSMTFADVFSGCKDSSSCKDTFIGIKYMKENAEAASDNRKKTPYQYTSWRMQKDRMAHLFLPMMYEDYEVTAAVSQTFPVPEPQSTYGPQTMLWKASVLPLCTFKVGDSGRPTRSVLLLLSDLAEGAVKGSFIVQQALFNLLLQLCVHEALSKTYARLRLNHTSMIFPAHRPMLGHDIEAHIYGEITADDVLYALLPDDADDEVKDGFGGRALIYDAALFKKREKKLEETEDGSWMNAIAPLKLE